MVEVSRSRKRWTRYLLYGIPLYVFLVLAAIVPVNQLALGIIRASGAIFLIGFLVLCGIIASRDARSSRR